MENTILIIQNSIFIGWELKLCKLIMDFLSSNSTLKNDERETKKLHEIPKFCQQDINHDDNNNQ